MKGFETSQVILELPLRAERRSKTEHNALTITFVKNCKNLVPNWNKEPNKVYECSRQAVADLFVSGHSMGTEKPAAKLYDRRVPHEQGRTYTSLQKVTSTEKSKSHSFRNILY
eukprot:2457252-Amphidinium_carterae.1